LAGKTVKCPKCQTAFALPAAEQAFDVVDDNEPVVARPKVKPPEPDPGFSVVPEDDEPKPRKIKKRVVEEDEEDEYVPRRRSSASAAGNTRMFVLLGGLVAFLAVAAGGIYYAVSKVDVKPNAETPQTPGPGPAPTPGPVEWTPYTPKDGTFTVLLPGTPTEQAGGVLGADTRGWELTAGDWTYKIALVKLPELAEGLGDSILDSVMGEITSHADNEKGINQTSATLGKYPAKQVAYSEGPDGKIVRAATVGSQILVFEVTHKGAAVGPDDDGAKKFFGGITVK
jgi:hypothetical protein